MIEAKFTEQMLAVLKEMKGKTFKSYEATKLMGDAYYANCRINLGTFSIDVTNYVEDTPFFDGTEDIPIFKCFKAEKGSELKPVLVGVSPHAYMVDEIIKEVKIVNDDIIVNDGEYRISIDQALIIKTNCNTYSFYKDWMFSENINIKSDRKKEFVYDIEKVRYDWSDQGKDKTEIKRTTLNL